MEKRIQECARLGFTRLLVPKGSTLPKLPGLQYTQIETIKDAVRLLGL